MAKMRLSITIMHYYAQPHVYSPISPSLIAKAWLPISPNRRAH